MYRPTPSEARIISASSQCKAMLTGWYLAAGDRGVVAAVLLHRSIKACPWLRIQGI